jgi:hypothetical protein
VITAQAWELWGIAHLLRSFQKPSEQVPLEGASSIVLSARVEPYKAAAKLDDCALRTHWKLLGILKQLPDVPNVDSALYKYNFLTGSPFQDTVPS